MREREYRWTNIKLQTTVIRLTHATAAEAEAIVTNLGWTPPRWWQLWRLFDYPRQSLVNVETDE